MSFISELKRRNVIRMAGLACGAQHRAAYESDDPWSAHAPLPESLHFLFAT